MCNTRDLMKSNEHWRVFQCVLSFENKKILVEEKSHWVKHQLLFFFFTLGIACVRELIRTRVMSMKSLILFMT